MEAKRIIHSFNFDQPLLKSGQKTHLSLVDAGANLQEVLVMKSSKSVTSTIHIDEYDDSSGKSTSSRDSVSIRDYGGDYLYITEESYNVVDYSVEKQ